MKILGIETSCDETAAAIVENGVKILSNVVSSSLEFHAKTGGVIPEVAAREQVKAMVPMLEKALADSPKTTVYSKDKKPVPKSKLAVVGSRSAVNEIDAIAVTYGPGLVGSLLVGVEAAKTLSYVWKKPLVPVNHLVGHIYANWLDNPDPPKFPSLALIVSGGHTELVLMTGHGKFEWLGGTRDDAAGEAFDKTARVLGLGYPGGPEIQKAAAGGNPAKFNLPRPLSESAGYDFSFSGLKTAVVNLAAREKPKSKTEVADLAAEIQEAIVDSLLKKAFRAAKRYGTKELILAGGVAANKRLRQKAQEGFDGRVICSDTKLSVDNAAMIASAAYFNYKPVPWNKVEPDPGLLI